MKSSHSINALQRWSCKPKPLPAINAIKNIHVYDFDNTLFSSPLPNPQLWHPSTIGLLQAYEVFTHGGWWHNPDVLAATGGGIEEEEPRAWKGWWNETIVSLVETSMAEKETVTILLTGRGEPNFAEIINRMADAKKLDFDMVVLKPEVGPNQQQFGSTMDFKQAFLRDLVFTYRTADNIKIYEDRVKHVKGFRDFMEKFNKSFLHNPTAHERTTTCTADVVHVCELRSSLEPQAEIMAIQNAVNRHNKAIRTGGPNPNRAPEKFYRIHEQFQYFGYMINQTDSARLITLCNAHAHLIDSGEVKYMASSILIVPYYPRKDTFEKVGPKGTRITWQVTGVAKFEDRIWAARVTPISDKPTYTQDDIPMVILAIRKGSKQIDANRIKNWQPPSAEKQFIFETTVDSKVMLKLEELDENAAVDEYNNRQRSTRQHNKRKHQEDGEPGKENHFNQASQGEGQSWAQMAQGNKNSQQNGGNRYFNKSKNNFNNKRSHNQFNNNSNSAASPNGIPTQPQNQANQRKQRGGAGGGRGGRSGGYKSLDDYNNGSGFDSGNDAHHDNNAAAASAMVMNY